MRAASALRILVVCMSDARTGIEREREREREREAVKGAKDTKGRRMRGRLLTSGILLVVHEEQLELLDVADAELEEAVRHHEPGLLVVSVADLDVELSALEAAALTSIHTMGLAPRRLLRERRGKSAEDREGRECGKGRMGAGQERCG